MERITSPPNVVIEGGFQPVDEKRYVHLPFEVPPGVRALHVSYQYSGRVSSDPLVSGNTLDIGLFDPRGIAPSSPGFRGWSGSNKLAFSLAETWATPPYTAGPILPGRWHVLLGPYKVAPTGCQYRVEIRFDANPGAADPRPTTIEARPPALPPAAPGWLRGDLHCHTLHSDGDSWPEEVLACAVETGLDFLGVTDHNSVGHHADYARVRGPHLPILLHGVEVTTYGGHWNVLGTETWWEFREPTSEATTRAMQAAAASGGLVVVNHPRPFGPAWEYPGATGYHAIEVWNGPWRWLNSMALAWWEEQIRAGRRVVALGGSDTHQLKSRRPPPWQTPRLGEPTTWAYVGEDRSARGILAALRAGRAFLSRSPAGPQLYLRCGAALPGDVLPAGAREVEVRVVSGAGATLALLSARGAEAAAVVQGEAWRATFPLPPDLPGYLRAQIVNEQGDLLALTNPLYAP